MGKENHNVFDNLLVINDIIPGVCHDADLMKQDLQASHKDVEEAAARVIPLAQNPTHHTPGQLESGEVHDLEVRPIVLASLLAVGVEERGDVDHVHFK